VQSNAIGGISPRVPRISELTLDRGRKYKKMAAFGPFDGKSKLHFFYYRGVFSVNYVKIWHGFAIPGHVPRFPRRIHASTKGPGRPVGPVKPWLQISLYQNRKIYQLCVWLAELEPSPER
jgi:hypothetical protein